MSKTGLLVGFAIGLAAFWSMIASAQTVPVFWYLNANLALVGLGSFIALVLALCGKGRSHVACAALGCALTIILLFAGGIVANHAGPQASIETERPHKGAPSFLKDGSKVLESRI